MYCKHIDIIYYFYFRGKCVSSLGIRSSSSDGNISSFLWKKVKYFFELFYVTCVEKAARNTI